MKKTKKKEMTKLIISLFNNEPETTFSQKQISQRLNISKRAPRLRVIEVLQGLLAENYLQEVSRGVFKLQSTGSYLEGIFDRKSAGKNYLIPNTGGEPIFVAERNSKHAMKGDKVKVHLYARRRGYPLEGEVVEILEHVKSTFVGTLEVSHNFAFLLTDKRMAHDIFIPKDKLKNGKSGDKAIVKITHWPDKSKNPIGEVVDILGTVGENTAEMHAILVEFGLPYKYPQNVEKAAGRISSEISPEEIAKREDFRDAPTFTIDPVEAKDFDDALSIRKTEKGTWEIGIHIADVTHYVAPGGAIDKEASKRATSVYLVDRTVPMLPEKLCNDLCSLNQGTDKLTFSVICEMNDKAEVLNSRIVRTIINSNKRFSYEEAQEILETGEGELADELLKLNELAKKLREKRFAAGSIDFDRFEVKFELDEKGKPVNVYFKEAKDSNKLIEEFMLLANRKVAEFIGKTKKGIKAKTFVYRIHDVPNPEKMENFSEFIKRFGYKLKTQGTKSEVSKSINRLLDKVKGQKEQTLIETVAVRAMAKAIYSTQNIGHYGLAFEHYTHFTSPIRRYPDMMVHRLLERYMKGGKSIPLQKCEDDCKHCSDMEQLAANAERASIKYKQVEFMNDKLGQIFDGVISGVTEWGLYVELNANKCEGMIPIRCLDDDFYEFDEKSYCLIGRRNKRKYLLGDPITIKVAYANLEKKQLDFALVWE